MGHIEKSGCHWITVFGNPVLFDIWKTEDTASPKTPMQWHNTQTFFADYAFVL